jgi:hypothetical protein
MQESYPQGNHLTLWALLLQKEEKIPPLLVEEGQGVVMIS